MRNNFIRLFQSIGTGTWSCVVILLLVAPNGPLSAQILTIGDGLNGYWAFDDPSDIGRDSSTNGNNLTRQGNPAYATNGILGGAVDLNGLSDYLASDSFPVGIPTGDAPYTIAAWFKPRTIGDRGIIGWGAYGSVKQVNALRLLGGNGFRHYWWGCDLDADAGSLNVNLLDGNWHHIAAVYDGSARQLWLDARSLNLDHVNGNNSQRLNFAVGKTLGSEYFDGGLDEVRVYSRALSAEEIAILYNFPALASTSCIPILLSQPRSQTVPRGEAALLSVGAISTQTLHYSWLANGVPVPGASKPTLLLTNVQFSDAGNYVVVVSNACGSVTSEACRLSVQPTDLPSAGPIVTELQPLEDAVKHFMTTNQVKSAVIALMKDKRLVFRQGYGWRDTNLTVATHPDNIFAIASISKVLTATAVQKLKDEGLLNLDAKVYPLVGIAPPGGVLGDSRIPSISVRNCLDHSAGFVDQGTQIQVAEDLGLNRPPEATNIISWMLTKRLGFSPGTSNLYSGTGYNYLGRVIEKVSGKPYLNYLKEDLLGPFGITNIILTASRPEERPAWEIWYDDSATARSAPDYPTNKLVRIFDSGYTPCQDAHGGLSASMLDLCRFMQHYYLGGGARGSGYGYWWGWVYVFFGAGPGNSSAIHQEIDLQVNSVKSLEFAVAVNKGVGTPHDALVSAANAVTSWPANGGGEIQWELPEQFVQEAQGSVAVSLYRSGLNNRQVKVSYSTYPVTAGPGDYTPKSGVVTFAPGETYKLITVPIATNTHSKATKDFSVELISASGGAWLGDRVTCMVHILDPDALSSPEVTMTPVGKAAPQGSDVTFALGTSGTAPLNVQWRRNGINLPGSTGTSLTITNVQPGDIGDYTALVSNAAGSVTSAAATLIVISPTNLKYGGLRAEAYYGIPGYTIGHLLGCPRYPESPDAHWILSNAEAPVNFVQGTGLRVSGFIIPPVTGNFTFYLCSDDQSALWLSADDHPANVRMIAFESSWNAPREYVIGANQRDRGTPPSNISSPILLRAGQRYYVTAVMKDGSGGNNLSFAWMAPGGPVVTNGSAPIPGAFLAWLVSPPVITCQPQDQAATTGEEVRFTVAAMGDPPLKYQWFRNGIALLGATDRTLVLPCTQISDVGKYQVSVQNDSGSSTSCTAQLDLSGLPIIYAQPSDARVAMGQIIVFSVSALGNRFQWCCNGTNLLEGPRTTGTHSSTLVISNAELGDSGMYSVIVGSSRDTATSQAAKLTVVSSSIIGWGSNLGSSGEHVGQIEVPIYLTNAVAVASGWWHSVALRSDGTVVAWGYDANHQLDVPPGLTNVVAIAGRGDQHSLALKGDGSVVAWGYNGNGQTNVPSDLKSVIAIAAGEWHSVALKEDGTVAAWGYAADERTSIPAGVSNVCAISAGGAHTLALKGDGTIVAFGRNDYGQTSVPAGLADVTAISAGNYHNLALRRDSTVVAWGAGANPGVYSYPHVRQSVVPAGLSNVVAIAAGVDFSLALRADGTVVGWGFAEDGETDIPQDLTDVIALAGGARHALALIGPASSRLVRRPLQEPRLLPTGGFHSTISTVMGRNYTLQSAESLSDARWQSLPPIMLGDGFPRALADTNTSFPARYYRVRQR